MMNQDVHDFNNVDFEELQRFLSKLSSVKKTVKKLYDKKVMVLIKQHKENN
jgi:diadenosine tetraphosphate (Ap4A) HIT family hydrolase